MASNIGEKAQDIAVADLRKAGVVAREAAKSQAYFYPFKGIYFFIMNPVLWKPVQRQFVPTLTVGTVVTVSMFLVTYMPQAAIMAIFNGPFAVISTIALVLSESSTITNLITRNLYIDESLIDTFDATLVIKNMTPLVAEGRTIKGGAGDAIGRLGKLLKKPFENFALSNVIRYFMYLPLYMIPFFGTFIYIFLQGKKFGPEAHIRYFQLKKLSTRDRNRWVASQRPAYTSFGIAATVLEMVPFAGIFFAFTNTTGAALWAVDLEEAHAIEKEMQTTSTS